MVPESFERLDKEGLDCSAGTVLSLSRSCRTFYHIVFEAVSPPRFYVDKNYLARCNTNIDGTSLAGQAAMGEDQEVREVVLDYMSLQMGACNECCQCPGWKVVEGYNKEHELAQHQSTPGAKGRPPVVVDGRSNEL